MTMQVRLSEREIQVTVTALRSFMETHYNAASNPRMDGYATRFKALGDEAGELCDKIGTLAQKHGCDVISSLGELRP